MELQRSLERWAYESKNASVTSITGTPHELTANLVKIQTYPIIIISYTVLHEGLSWPEYMKVMSANKSVFTSRHKHSEGAEEKVGNKESITTCFRDNNVNVRKIPLVVKCREKREELIIFTESPLLFHHFLKLTWKVFFLFFTQMYFSHSIFPMKSHLLVCWQVRAGKEGRKSSGQTGQPFSWMQITTCYDYQ